MAENELRESFPGAMAESAAFAKPLLQLGTLSGKVTRVRPLEDIPGWRKGTFVQ